MHWEESNLREKPDAQGFGTLILNVVDELGHLRKDPDNDRRKTQSKADGFFGGVDTIMKILLYPRVSSRGTFR